MRPYRIAYPFTLTLLALVCLLRATQGLAAEEEDALQGYKECRKLALTHWRQGGGTDRRGLQNAIAVCREKFPGADVYIQCKKQAVLSQKSAADLQTCARQAKAASTATTSVVPLFRNRQGDLVFAGVNLGQPISLKGAAAVGSDFNCDDVKDFGKNPAKVPEYLGFGNSLGTFSALSSLGGSELKALFPEQQDLTQEKGKPKRGKARTKRPEKHRDIRYFARVTGLPIASHSSVLFPVGHCKAARKLDEKYEDLKIYYLIDQEKSLAYPYLGVVFYDANVKMTRPKVSAALGKILGGDFKEQEAPKGGKILFAKSSLSQYDEEGDPFNLCQSSNQENYIGLMKESLQTKGVGEFFLVANIRNLCQYGEQIVKRYVAMRRSRVKK